MANPCLTQHDIDAEKRTDCAHYAADQAAQCAACVSAEVYDTGELDEVMPVWFDVRCRAEIESADELEALESLAGSLRLIADYLEDRAAERRIGRLRMAKAKARKHWK